MKIVLEVGFLFSSHCIEDDWVFPVNWEVAVLVMGRDTGVGPILSFYRTSVFFASSDDLSRSLADIFFPAGAVKAIDPLLLSLVLFWGAFGTKDVSEFLATLEDDI